MFNAAMQNPLAAYGDRLASYQTLPGVADELLTPDGAVRPVWQPFLQHLSELDSDDLNHRFATADQYLRDAGVYFRLYLSESWTERVWPLSHIPVLIEQQEWAQIADALCQRADLLERVVADVYGDNRLVSDGLLPPELLAGNNGWLRPLVGVEPRGGYHLHHIAFDIGRGPKGRWWVLADRTQAPSGAGFALETRLATNRAFTSMMGDMRVMRLAGFFRAFRNALQRMCDRPEGRVSILTPGPWTDTYYEHAYIARYLGLNLVQGADLTVEHGQLMMRTITGLRPVEALWRRLDADWADALELNETSQIGTPGLIDALRAGSTTLINSLGSGVVEARAFMAFIPRLCEHLLGQPLAMPNIATWWCGAQDAREYVVSNLERMTIDEAMTARLPFQHGPHVVIGGKTVGGGDVNPDWVRSEKGQLAAQEILSLSTTPAWVEGRLSPRPMSLRVFLVRDGGGWRVMPGGFARIGSSNDSADISMQRGGSVADVWVGGGSEQRAATLLNPLSPHLRQAEVDNLPSSAAENLLWLGRYIERCEDQCRLLRAHHLRLAETGTLTFPLVREIAEQLSETGVSVDEAIPSGFLSNLAAALRNAGSVRDRFSTDGWNALSDLDKVSREFATRVHPGDDAARAYAVLLRKLSGLTGLVYENMYQSNGWRFLSLGRGIERVIVTLRLIQACCREDAPAGALDLAVEVGDSVMTHRWRFNVDVTRNSVIDLLLLDGRNPRSVHHQLKHLSTLGSGLPDRHDQTLPRFGDIVGTMLERLTGSRARDIATEDLDALIAASYNLHTRLAATYLR